MDGNQILADSLTQHGVDTVYFLMGGPLLGAQYQCEKHGIRMIDVRHEQAAAMMATASARLRRAPAVCMGCSGPGVMNLASGIANAWADGSPVIAIGGASPVSHNEMLCFQEMDQVAVFQPITRWAAQCPDARRIPEYVNYAFRMAFGHRPGPVYLDLPGDVLYQDVPDEEIRWVPAHSEPYRPAGGAQAIEDAAEMLAQAQRPIIISGSGVIWSGGEKALLDFVDASGIPFWTTPQGRGVIPEDHALSFLASRSVAFQDCDLILQIATRQNYMIGYVRAPRFNPDAKLIQVDIDGDEIGRNRRPDVGIVGDARAVLEQLYQAVYRRLDPGQYQGWCERLRVGDLSKKGKAENSLAVEDLPIHPLRLCKEVRDWLPRDAVLVVDGQEILTYARQSIPFYHPHSLNSGPFGTMGVGLPLALGAKAVRPESTVVVLHGDGSFGLNAMEMDTALRHDLPIICVISNNGGWTATDTYKVGRDLGDTRYDQMFRTIGCFGTHVEKPGEIRVALQEAYECGRPAIVNVATDPAARAGQAQFTNFST